jgi:hypothetical protein
MPPPNILNLLVLPRLYERAFGFSLGSRARQIHNLYAGTVACLRQKRRRIFAILAVFLKAPISK